MKSIVLYAVTKQPKPDAQGSELHYRIVNPYPPKPQVPIWVRSEIHPGLSCEQALEKAKPRDGEIVMNSVEV
jgi:hypothetical protein